MQNISAKPTTKSNALFENAKKRIPGGVNSPVRAFKSVGGTPPFIQSAQGAYLMDADGNRYVDYVGAWGPMILGHADPIVIAKITETLKRGLSFGAPCELEVELASEICRRIPSVEKIRMVNSGTEATMSAIRLARGVTGRAKVIKFEGCYHGHADHLLVKAGSGALTFGVPSSPGVPVGVTQDTLVANFNDIDSVRCLFEKYADEIACVIVEPIAGNMNLLLPIPGFLEGLRELCDDFGSLLIFDEVMTGFRVSYRGAQGLYSVTPDLTTFGKIIGGGLPVGAFGGAAHLMDALSPQGPVYQAGTLSGNPIAMAAGLATLQSLTENSYRQLADTTQKLVSGFLVCAGDAGVPMTAHHICGMFGLFFTEEKNITHHYQVIDCDQGRFNAFFHAMLEAGIYLAPSAFEVGFVSLAHGEVELSATLAAAKRALELLKKRDHSEEAVAVGHP